MFISKISGNTVCINGTNASIGFTWDFDKVEGKDKDKVDIYLNGQYFDGDSKDSVLIDSPGEYEIKGVYVKGLSSHIDSKTTKKQVNSYRINFDDFVILYLSPTSKKLDKDIQGIANDVDILILDMDEIFSEVGMSEKELHSIITSVSPSLLIPITDSLDKQKTLINKTSNIIEIKKSKNIRKKDFLGSGLSVVKFL